MNTTYCLSSQLDIFKGPAKQVSQEKNAYVPHYPITTLTGGPLEFDISPSPMYTDLSETRLYLRCKVVDSAGTLVAADADVGVVNMLFHALFNKVDVMVGGRLITQSSDTYPWKAALETILNFGNDAKSSQLISIGYSKDSSDPNVVNEGHAARVQKCKAEFELMGPLHIDFFMQEKYLVNGVPIRIKLTRSNSAFCIQGTVADGASYSLVITQAVLYVRRVKVSPSIEIAHAKSMEKCNALYPIHQTELTIIPLGAGLRSLTKDNLFAGKVPRKLVIAMISSDAYNGSYSTSPFQFSHNKLNRVDITFEGESVGDTPLAMDFDKNLYMRAYQNLFTALNKSYSDTGLDISYSDFKHTYPLLCFDLTSDGCGNTTAHFEVEKQGTLRIQMNFSDNLANTIYVIFYAEFEKVIEITKAREILA